MKSEVSVLEPRGTITTNPTPGMLIAFRLRRKKSILLHPEANISVKPISTNNITDEEGLYINISLQEFNRMTNRADENKEEKHIDKTATPARIKKMRGWLRTNATAALDGYIDENDAPFYGDGHSGWNR